MNAQTFILIAAIVLIGVGALLCFFGFKVFRVVLIGLGFLVGAVIGGSITTNETGALIASIICGLIGAGVGYILYLGQVIIAGSVLGAAIAAVIFGIFRLDSETVSTLALIGAIIGAGVAFFLRAYIVILNTAFTGATQVVYGILLLIPGKLTLPEGMIIRNARQVVTLNIKTTTAENVVLLIMILVLGIVGLLFQISTNKDALKTQDE